MTFYTMTPKFRLKNTFKLDKNIVSHLVCVRQLSCCTPTPLFGKTGTYYIYRQQAVWLPIYCLAIHRSRPWQSRAETRECRTSEFHRDVGVRLAAEPAEVEECDLWMLGTLSLVPASRLSDSRTRGPWKHVTTYLTRRVNCHPVILCILIILAY